MMAASHRLGGAAAGILACSMLTAPDDIAGKTVILSAAVLGSLIPDIDNPHSSISRKYRGINAVVSVIQTFFRGIAELLPRKQEKYIKGAAGHRGASHSLLMMLLCVALVHIGGIFLPAWRDMITLASWGVGIGVLSHLFLDMFAGGVPLLFPFTMNRVTLGHIKTGGITEWLIRAAAIGILTMIVGKEIMKWI